MISYYIETHEHKLNPQEFAENQVAFCHVHVYIKGKNKIRMQRLP